MEDKWFIYTHGPDASGSAKVNFHRSWHGEKVAELGIEIPCLRYNGDDDMWNGKIVTLTMENDAKGWSEEESAEEFIKFQILEVCNCVLKIRLVMEIREPASWEALSKVPAVVPRPPRKTYRAVIPSKETREDIERLGGWEEAIRKTKITFT